MEKRGKWAFSCLKKENDTCDILQLLPRKLRNCCHTVQKRLHKVRPIKAKTCFWAICSKPSNIKLFQAFVLFFFFTTLEIRIHGQPLIRLCHLPAELHLRDYTIKLLQKSEKETTFIEPYLNRPLMIIVVDQHRQISIPIVKWHHTYILHLKISYKNIF